MCVYSALCELSPDTGAQLLLRVTGGGVDMTQPPGPVIPEAYPKPFFWNELFTDWLLPTFHPPGFIFSIQ